MADTADSTINPLNALFHTLANGLTKDDVNDMKNLLRGKQVHEGEMDNLTCAWDVFHHLQNRIGDGTLDLLKDLFKEMSKYPLRRKVEDFQSPDAHSQREEPDGSVKKPRIGSGNFDPSLKTSSPNLPKRPKEQQRNEEDGSAKHQRTESDAHSEREEPDGSVKNPWIGWGNFDPRLKTSSPNLPKCPKEQQRNEVDGSAKHQRTESGNMH